MTFHGTTTVAGLAARHATERAELARLRCLLELELDLMIELLDRIDGDPDQEPELGSVAVHERVSQAHWADGLDADEEHDGAEPDEDGEPTLGSVTGFGGSQLHWSEGDNGGDDYEVDGDDEPDIDAPLPARRPVPPLVIGRR